MLFQPLNFAAFEWARLWEFCYSCLYCCGNVVGTSWCFNWQPELLPRPCCIATQMAISLPELCQDCDTQHNTTLATCRLVWPTLPSLEIMEAINPYCIISVILIHLNWWTWRGFAPYKRWFIKPQLEAGKKFSKHFPLQINFTEQLQHCNSVTYWLTELQVFCIGVSPGAQDRLKVKSRDSILI